MKTRLTVLLVFGVLMGLYGSVRAAPIAFASIDGDVFSLTVTQQGTRFVIPPQSVSNAEGSVDIAEGEADVGGALIYFFGVRDLGAPSTFGFAFGIDTDPVCPSGLCVVLASGVGTIDSPPSSPGASITPAAPPFGIPTDTDGLPEVQVNTVSADGGMTFITMGVDVFPAAVTSLPHLFFHDSVFALGPSGGPFNFLRTDVNFTLSGDDDSAVFVVAVGIFPVPEPRTLTLYSIGLASLVIARWWRKQGRRRQGRSMVSGH